MDTQQARATTGGPSSPELTGWRTVGVFLASAAGYVLGFYMGVAALLAVFGLDSASDAPWSLATIGLGSIVAGLGATLASPLRGWTPLTVSMILGAVAIVISLLIDGGFDYGIGTGVVVAIGSAASLYVQE